MAVCDFHAGVPSQSYFRNSASTCDPDLYFAGFPRFPEGVKFNRAHVLPTIVHLVIHSAILESHKGKEFHPVTITKVKTTQQINT